MGLEVLHVCVCTIQPETHTKEPSCYQQQVQKARVFEDSGCSGGLDKGDLYLHGGSISPEKYTEII